jgi:hypothetical protein
MKYLNLIVLSIFFFNCSNISKLKNITSLNDSVLNNAKEESVNDFLQRRNKNEEMYKINGKKCDIIYEGNDWIYYGYPHYKFDKTQKKQIFCDTLFKVLKRDILKSLPNYKEFEGYKVRKILYPIIKEIARVEKCKYFTYKFEYCEIKTQRILEYVLITLSNSSSLLKKRKYIKFTFDNKSMELLSQDIYQPLIWVTD